MEGLGDYSPMGGAMITKRQEAYHSVNLRCLSHYGSFYGVPFGMYVSLRNEKLKIEQSRELCISRICRGATIWLMATQKIGLFRGLGNIINATKFYVDRFNHFGSTRGWVLGSPIGTANGPHRIGWRYRATMWLVVTNMENGHHS
jgi:hypothetical protein